ncbi:40S ribosomal protein S3 [Mycena leptocephala]|nr:40S ribosomal protein S3 [Mycena leptocephala]
MVTATPLVSANVFIDTLVSSLRKVTLAATCVTYAHTEIIIHATHTQEVLGEKGRRIRELTALVQKRFKFPVELYAEKVLYRGIFQCESLRYKLLGGLAVRRACYDVLRFVMKSGAKGCEVVFSGKLRAARAKSMKFTDGFMIHTGLLGIKHEEYQPEGQTGPRKPLPDSVIILELEPLLRKTVSEPTLSPSLLHLHLLKRLTLLVFPKSTCILMI